MPKRSRPTPNPAEHPTPNPADLWGRSEAASFLRQSTASLDRGVRTGKVPHYRLNNRVLFDPADLKAIVSSGYRPVEDDD